MVVARPHPKIRPPGKLKPWKRNDWNVARHCKLKNFNVKKRIVAM